MPREGEPRNCTQDTSKLKQELINNGLMEYISIPWDNHSEMDRNSVDVWTVNLALWFVHILAGNNFEASWSYINLADEALVLSQAVQSCTESPSASSISVEDPEDERGQRIDEVDSAEDSDTTNPNTPSELKRKRESDDEDEEEGFNLSFSKRQNI
ncbi:hypothetical protein FIE12Z_7883 [Fusarium flagelliforme]|uniref:Uncharacterized protein n=2 Tax=Fusarium flagelliforme TaxID=2675880 RepID=A0A395MJ10_9HYPO|nr:hypothetical protein FIE12Z_7883 [Fusarium flagelliforme]